MARAARGRAASGSRAGWLARYPLDSLAREGIPRRRSRNWARGEGLYNAPSLRDRGRVRAKATLAASGGGDPFRVNVT